MKNKTLKVNEWFYSLQGEGRRAGEASIFIRLTGCDKTCNFCDTEFESGADMTLEEIEAQISDYEGKYIVWTGGEPTLQLDDEVIQFFKKRGYKQAIETNGGHPVPSGIDWVCVSPKVAEHVVKKNFPNGVDELRYVRQKNQIGAPEPKIEAKHYYVSPMFDGNSIVADNLARCIKVILENPKWKLSLQSHKLTKIL